MSRAFRYVAKSGPGDRVEGVMQADSASGVARALLSRGMYPVDVAELSSRHGLADRLGPLGPLWRRLVDNGMTRDFSWRRSAAAYLDLYRAASGH